MAKMTIDNVTYEGTPEELRDIVKAFSELVAEEVEPAETITFKGAEYALVSRKAQAGDVVVFTENKYRHLTNGKPYEVKGGVDEALHVDDDDDGSFARLFMPWNRRTENTTLVYEKAAEESPLKVGDKVEVIDGSNSRYGDLQTGTIGKITDIDVDYGQMYQVTTEDDWDRFHEEALRKIPSKAASVKFFEGDVVFAEEGDTASFYGIVTYGPVGYSRGGNYDIERGNGRIETILGDDLTLIARAKDRVDTK